ncbi:MAG: phenylacetate--CoA ligase family protein [Methanoregulaceae archaeon]|jgi:phenylacetate-CoA ligase
MIPHRAIIKNRLRKLADIVMGMDINNEYHEISNINNPDILRSFIQQRLRALFLHAYHHTRYYHQIFDQIGIIQDDYVDLALIKEIPVLTKEIIRKNFNELISDDYQKRGWFYNSSGGSTGEPIKLIQDKQFLRWAKATNYYYYKNILGIDQPAVKKVIVWGSERDIFTGTFGIKTKLSNYITNTILLNSFRMTPEDIERYINTINEYKPEFIRGYAGSLYEICSYAEKNDLSIYSPKIIESAAETLNDEMRDQIERIFGTKLYNFYGSREVSNLAGECKKGLMHPFMFWNYQELLDQHNQHIKEGENGKVIVTNLFNYSMPLIRYEIGDTAILGPEQCSCGNVLPTYKKVTGRITDHFRLKDGTTIPAEFFIHLIGVVYLRGDILKFQVIQEDYEILKILVVTNKNLTDSYMIDIESKIKVVMGPNCRIIWEFIDDIPKTPSGKYLYTKSHIKT